MKPGRRTRNGGAQWFLPLLSLIQQTEPRIKVPILNGAEGWIAVLELLSLRDPVKVRAVRQRFALLGQRWQFLAELELHQKWVIETEALRMSAAQAQVAALEARIQSLEKELETQNAAQRQLRANAARRSRLMRAGFANLSARGAVVVIPLYNYAHCIEEPLESVRAKSLE
jgi:hypothetical protein